MLSSSIAKPKIGYTLGDLAGIGPEIFQKFKDKHASKYPCEIILVDKDFDKDLELGKASAYAGLHSYKTLARADAMLKNSELDYLITGPVSKESLALADLKFSGQTEILAHLNSLSSDDVEMIFIVGDLRILLVTRHEALSKVAKSHQQRLAKALEHAQNFVEKFLKLKDPRIAVLGLNPHAGEKGNIGTEEIEYILPCVQECKIAKGPLVPDSSLARAGHNYLSGIKQEYDIFLAAYHDQALPLMKALSLHKTINLTYGLPYLRCSVDHGSAFDIAGLNQADESALVACTEFCLTLHKNH